MQNSRAQQGFRGRRRNLTNVEVGRVVGKAEARVGGAVYKQNIGDLVPGVRVRLEAGAAGCWVEGPQLRQESAADAAAPRSPATTQQGIASGSIRRCRHNWSWRMRLGSDGLTVAWLGRPRGGCPSPSRDACMPR